MDPSKHYKVFKIGLRILLKNLFRYFKQKYDSLITTNDYMLFIYDSSNRGLRIHSWEVWNTNESRKQCCFVAIHACLVKKERSTTSPETQVLHSVLKLQKKSPLNFLFQILWFLWQKWFIEKVWIWDFLSDFLTLWWFT